MRLRILTHLMLCELAIGVSGASAGCPNGASPIAIVFVNGVNSDPDDALDSIVALRSTLTSSLGYPAENCFEFDYAYNHNELYFADFIEAARQVLGESSRSFWSFLARLDSAPGWFRDLVVAEISSLDYRTYVQDEDLQDHLRRYRESLDSGIPILLVPHSQGNLYANEAFALLSTSEAANVRVVAVATPASSVAQRAGPYTTLREDFVATFLFPLGRLLANTTNADSAVTCDDFLCHGFVTPYLSGTASRALILSQILTKVDELSPGYNFTLQSISIDGNILGGGDPDGSPEFIDGFNDARTDVPPTSSFSCIPSPCLEEARALQLREADANGASDRLLFFPWRLGEVAQLQYPRIIARGQGDARMSARFRASVPEESEGYGIGILDGFISLPSSVSVTSLFVATGSTGHPAVVLYQTGSPALAADFVDLSNVTSIELRLDVDDERIEITASYTLYYPDGTVSSYEARDWEYYDGPLAGIRLHGFPVVQAGLLLGSP